VSFPNKTRVWSGKRLVSLRFTATCDLAPDGKRMAALMQVEAAEAEQVRTHVIFLESFFDELRRKVPAGK